MKIQLLMAINDSDYAEHLSQSLTEQYADMFEVSICSANDRLKELTDIRRFEVALLSPGLTEYTNLQMIQLPLLLWDGMTAITTQEEALKKIRKYQRISGIISEILAQYAEVSDGKGSFDDTQTHITAVWSPAGGCGKTTVAIAYAAQKVAAGRKTVYLDMEPFSSTDVYFTGKGKSISTVLGKLESNVDILIQSIRQEDKGSGIYYFCKPENYDDINILTVEDIAALVKGCARGVEELVVDLSGACDEKVKYFLETADNVLLVVDATQNCQIKWEQFRTQNNLYEKLRSKLTLVANRNARVDASQAQQLVSLPIVQSNDPIVVYKTLSYGYFNE